MVLWVFDGNMVGKWMNEPCNGVDEVVNHFGVLTVICDGFPIADIKFSLSSLLILLYGSD